LIFKEKNSNKLFFMHKDFGIVTYNELLKEVYLYEFKDDNYIYEYCLNEILRISNVEKRNIFKKLYEVTNHYLLKIKVESLLEKEISFFAGINNNQVEHFSESEHFLSFFGVEEVKEINLKIIKTFYKDKDIEKERKNDIDENIIYGFWDIKTEEIISCFLYKSLIQTQMCFSDFANNALKEGSLFLKLKKI